VNQRNQTDDNRGGNSAFDQIVQNFLSILESRLKNTKTIVLQIFVLMLSTEAESAQMISTMQEIKFAFDGAYQTTQK
jgi:hypothetical protein